MKLLQTGGLGDIYAGCKWLDYHSVRLTHTYVLAQDVRYVGNEEEIPDISGLKVKRVVLGLRMIKCSCVLCNVQSRLLEVGNECNEGSCGHTHLSLQRRMVVSSPMSY